MDGAPKLNRQWDVTPSRTSWERKALRTKKPAEAFPGAVLLLAVAVCCAFAQTNSAPTAQELTAITERGILLNEYDQAAWHASDAVQTANPKKIEGQRYIAKKKTANGPSSLENSLPTEPFLKFITRRSSKQSPRNLASPKNTRSEPTPDFISSPHERLN